MDTSKVCPVCGLMSLVNVVKDVAGTKLHGVECSRCGWARQDGRAHRYDIECFDCKRKIGYVYLHESLKLHEYVCSDCSIEHLKTNNPRPLKVRFEVVCAGTCGKVVAWNDHHEGYVPRVESLKCLECK